MAEDGSILEVNKDESEYGTTKPDSSQKQSKTEPSQPTISKEQPTTLVLERTSSAMVRDQRIKLNQYDRIQKYAGDLIYEGKEYDFEIDASTGSFLDW